MRYTKIPGRKPASVMPTIIRNRYRLVGPVANSVQVEAMPHSTMMVAIQRRAPTIPSMILLGMPKIT
ncbi:hypothetical protein D3C77_718870 [compost metagenome]